MVDALRSKIFVILVLCFFINLAFGERWAVHMYRRDGPSSTITPSSSPTQSGGSSGGSTGSEATTSQPAQQSTSLASNSTTTSSSTSLVSSHGASVSQTYANLNGASPTASSNSGSAYNSTATPNLLPITPKITPGFSVAGVILMVTGVAYTFVGIKNKLLHIFISAAYLSSLAVTVLIIYVMNVPVSNAIQGAYLVAIAITGLILGGVSCVFPELTEGLGCLLGGFCLSMWFLVLKPGGLITSTGGIAAFIVAFSLTSFSISFNHITRPYGLIFGISFGGATAVVVGIDCFSQAGLKEFWAYIWRLNDNLFPVGATSYPLTRGLRVEIATIVLIFLAGILSQMKLWNVIKARRDARAAERLDDERTKQREEEDIRKRIEIRNAKARSQWEAVYGGKEVVKFSEPEPEPRDSGLGDMDSKKRAMSTVTSISNTGEDEIEMEKMSLAVTSSAGLVMSKGQDVVRVARVIEAPQLLDENGNILVQLATRPSTSENDPPETIVEEQVRVMGTDREAQFGKRISPRNSLKMSKSPEVVPLPFKVPEQEGEIEDDRSSVATFADDEQAGHKRLSNRLSTGSAFRRKLSQRSKRSSLRFSMAGESSTEDLMIPHEVEDDRRSSLAATMDGLSDDEDMRSVRSVQLPIEGTEQVQSQAPEDKEAVHSVTPDTHLTSEGPVSTTPMFKATISEPPNPAKELQQPIAHNSLTSSTDPKEVPEVALDEPDKPSNSSPSLASKTDSKPSSITKDRLPAQLSKVVMSYRTNEWAKHISTADAPELERLDLAEINPETAVPVNINDLQQTAATRPSATRTSSQASTAVTSLSRSSSSMSRSTPSLRPEYQDANQMPARSASQQSFHGGPLPFLNTRTQVHRNSSTPNIPHAIVESPIEDAFFTSYQHPPTQSPVPSMPPNSNMKYNANHAYNSTSTLMSKRDSVLQRQSSNGVERAMTDEDGDNISLSARRSIIRKSSNSSPSPIPTPYAIQGFDSHQPIRQLSTSSPIAREQALRTFRTSVIADRQAVVPTKANIEAGRRGLLEGRRKDDLRRQVEEKRRGEREREVEGRMRRGDMLEAHREALRKMQAGVKI